MEQRLPLVRRLAWRVGWTWARREARSRPRALEDLPRLGQAHGELSYAKVRR
jgi:hypothetical protein